MKMKMNRLRVAAIMLTVCVLVLSSAACSNANVTPSDSPTPTPTVTPTDTPSETPSETPTASPEAEVSDPNVYETSLESAPESWNPHTWVSAIDMVMLEYLTTPIVANITSTKFINKAAVEVKDITDSFEDKAKWGLESKVKNYIYQVDLNPLLKWEDGTPINADSYIDSMKELLDPAMGNFRAKRYSVGDEAIRGANKYVNKDKAGQTKYMNAVEVSPSDNPTYYLNPDVPCYFFNNDSMKAFYENGFLPYFFDDNDVDLYQKYADAAKGGYIKVTDEMKAELTLIAVAFGDKNPTAWIEFCFVEDGVYEEATWDDVGVLKTGDYQIVVIMEISTPLDKFNVLMKRNWIVHPNVYEASKTTTDGKITTNYNIPGGVTMSYGPYKLVSFDAGKEIILEKNENWYGWAEGSTDKIYTYEDFGTQNTVRITLPQIKSDNGDSGTTGETGETHKFPFAFETEDAFGNAVTAETLGEKEIFFVHLWATWCGPCVSEMGDLKKIYDKYSDRVGFLALVDDFDSNVKGAKRLLEYNELEFTNISSKVPELSNLLEMVKSGYIPTTILIDGDGNIIGEQIVGSYGMEYADFIDAALKEVNER